MKPSIDFLKAIRHTDRVYIRCLSPKNTPQPELEAWGMTYTDKSGKVKKSTVNGYIDLQTGEFYRRYGKEYKPVTDGWGHLLELNQQGFGVYFVVGHGGEKNNDITHGSSLFHESDRATLEQQQQEIDRITQEFGKPTAVVKTKKSLHSYWASEIITFDNLATYQRRWSQYSNCDDESLDDLAQIMRLPGFDHVSWNSKTGNFDRVQCQLLQLNDVSYNLEQFDLVLPALDVDRWCKRSLSALTETDADDRDMRTLAQYLPGFNPTGRKGWITAKCPAHDGESSDSIHIDSETGGFICHAGCSPSSVYHAAKAFAVANGHRFEVVYDDDLDRAVVDKKLNVIDTDFPLSKLFPSAIATPLAEYCQGTAVPQGLMSMALITCLATLVHPKTHLKCFGNTLRIAKPIFWLCIYGVSGNGKTHSYAPVLNALKKLGEEHNLLYELALEEWNENQRKAKRGKGKDVDPQILEQANQPPDRQRYWVGDVTIEALLSRCSKQKERGLLLYSPELLGWCLRMNPEKGELEYHLSLWDGDSVEGERIGREFTPVANPSVSVMGGVQPDVMARLVAKGEEIQNGFMPRMALVRFEEVPKPPLSKGSPINFSVMNTLFKAVADTGEPMEISLHPDCFDTSDRWDREMDNLRLAETRKSIKPLYPKFNGYSYRIALMLHIINRALDSTQPDEVPLSTFTAAIEFTRWLVSQSVSIYEELLGDEKEDTIAKFLNSTRYTGWLSVRQFHKPNWRKFKTADDARKAIEKMIELGYVEGNGEKLTDKKFKFRSVDTKKRGQVDKQPETISSKGFKPYTANVDAVDSKSANYDTVTVLADKESVDKLGDVFYCESVHGSDLVLYELVDTSLSTDDREPPINDIATVSADKNHNCPQPYTLNVDESKPFLESDSAVLSTCPQDLNVHKYKSDLKIGDEFIEIISNRSNNTSETIDDEGVEYEC